MIVKKEQIDGQKSTLEQTEVLLEKNKVIQESFNLMDEIN